MASAPAKAPVLGKQSKADLPAAVFGEEFHESLVHETARADLNARRRGTASTLGRGEVSMTTPRPGARRAPAAPASARSARRPAAAAASPSARSRAATPSRSTARPAAGRCARRSRCTPTAAASPCSRPTRFSEPATKQAAEALDEVGLQGPDAGRSSTPRRPAPSRAFATSRASPCTRRRTRRRRRRPRRRLAGGLRARPRDARGPRRRGQAEWGGRVDGPAPGDHRAGRLREELRADGGRQVHVPRRRPRPQDADLARGRGDLRRRPSSACARCRCARSRSAAACTAAAPEAGRRRSSSSAPGERIELFEGAAVAE